LRRQFARSTTGCPEHARRPGDATDLLSPAKGDRFVALGRVVRPGRKLMVCLGEVFAEDGGRRKQIALMTASMMVMDTSTGLHD